MTKFRLLDLKPFHHFLDYDITSKLCWTKSTWKKETPQHKYCLGARTRSTMLSLPLLCGLSYTLI